MFNFIIFQTVVIIILIVLYVYKIVSFSKKKAQIVRSINKKNLANKTQNFLGANHRKAFRVALNNKDCLVEILAIENKKIDKLKHKHLKGYIENISMRGLKLICSFDLPVKQSIMIETKFRLKDQQFSLKGEIVRKEEHNNKNTNGYGVAFTDISDEDQKSLNRILNQIILEEHNKIS